MDILNQAAERRFRQEMLEHSKAFAPELCDVIGDRQVQAANAAALERARGYGFSNCGPLRLFIELTLLLGSGFDTDPQYATIAAPLICEGDEMERAEQIHLRYLSYYHQVTGVDGENVDQSLERLLLLSTAHIDFSLSFGLSWICEDLRHVFPEKVAYMGETAAELLLSEAYTASREHHLTSGRGESLMTALMFTFGHHCHTDMLYPWIDRTLSDPMIKDADARTDRLERKAMTWLRHVISRNAERKRV